MSMNSFHARQNSRGQPRRAKPGGPPRPAARRPAAGGAGAGGLAHRGARADRGRAGEPRGPAGRQTGAGIAARRTARRHPADSDRFVSRGALNEARGALARSGWTYAAPPASTSANPPAASPTACCRPAQRGGRVGGRPRPAPSRACAPMGAASPWRASTPASSTPPRCRILPHGFDLLVCDASRSSRSPWCCRSGPRCSPRRPACWRWSNRSSRSAARPGQGRHRARPARATPRSRLACAPPRTPVPRHPRLVRLADHRRRRQPRILLPRHPRAGRRHG